MRKIKVKVNIKTPRFPVDLKSYIIFFLTRLICKQFKSENRQTRKKYVEL